MISRIHIIGGPGSGKTYLAKKLSAMLGISSHDLDEIFWDNSSNSYGTRNPPEVRHVLLQELLHRPQWILEGVYHQWVEDSFRSADIIVILSPPVGLRDWRILKRFAKRKVGLIKSKRETLRDLIALLRYNHEYDTDNLKRALGVLKPHEHKLFHCRSADEALERIKESSQRSVAPRA